MTQLTSCKCKSAAEESRTWVIGALGINRNCMEYLLIFLGHFAGIEFVTEFVTQMNRHLRIIPVQHLQDKI